MPDAGVRRSNAFEQGAQTKAASFASTLIIISTRAGCSDVAPPSHLLLFLRLANRTSKHRLPEPRPPNSVSVTSAAHLEGRRLPSLLDHGSDEKLLKDKEGSRAFADVQPFSRGPDVMTHSEVFLDPIQPPQLPRATVAM
ncbi:hypothetical protein ISCGN_012085 [Ixodes scapularis]